MVNVSIPTAHVFEDTSPTWVERVVGQDAAAITQASITSIAYKVYNPDADETEVVADGTLTVSTVVYDTLQTSDSRWTKDTTGFNFLWAVPATLFPTGSKRVRVDVLFTPASGGVFAIVHDFIVVSRKG